MTHSALSIVQATQAQATQVRGLLDAQFADHAIRVDDARLEHALGTLLASPQLGRVLLAREGDRAVGLAVLAFTWTLEHGGPVAWLDELYVAPQARGGGVGGRLLSDAIAIAEGAGCLTLELEVDASHARVESLYRREGFAPYTRSRWSRALTPR